MICTPASWSVVRVINWQETDAEKPSAAAEARLSPALVGAGGVCLLEGLRLMADTRPQSLVWTLQFKPLPHW